MARRAKRPAPTSPDLRAQILSDFVALKIPLRAEQFDAALARAQSARGSRTWNSCIN